MDGVDRTDSVWLCSGLCHKVKLSLQNTNESSASVRESKKEITLRTFVKEKKIQLDGGYLSRTLVTAKGMMLDSMHLASTLSSRSLLPI